MALLLSGCAIGPSTRPMAPPEVHVTLPNRTDDEQRLKTIVNDAVTELTDKLVHRGNGLLTHQPSPPNSASYPNLGKDNIAFYQYVKDINWYLNYMYSYTLVLNNYAIERGWKPPEQLPLCRVINMDSMRKLPKFGPASDPNNDLHQFEWDLAEYIKTIKIQYEKASDTLDAVQRAQRVLCVY